MDYTKERELYPRYGTAVCGIDEAGRGPLCGPVCAAAVILPEGAELPGINDSKKLSEKKREELYPLILERAVAVGIGSAYAEEIDRINILQATFLAMRRAVENLSVPASYALVDGNRLPGLEIPAECVVRGDATVISIAAASVVAKVTRDRRMCELARQYPQYGLEQHKGYPTKEHYQRIKQYGIAPFYRRSFLKNLSEK